jgi:hypothetical protein
MNTKNPYLNALYAAIYIVLIVLLMNTFRLDGPDAEATRWPIVIPMVMLSLFVLSAAVMGFLFAYEPLRLFLEGQKEKALPFFGKTVGTFALLALVFVAILVLVR